MALPQSEFFFTVEEYLTIERESLERHEYIDGHMILMAGESDEHNAICLNLGAELRDQLKGSPCQARTQNMKVRSGAAPKLKRQPKNFFSYPDVLVYCGEPKFHDEHRDVLLNPRIIIEILSPSTEAFDRGGKFIRYRNYNETLTDYILVSQTEPLVEHFSRQSDGNWLMSPTSGLDKTVHIPSIDCHLQMSEIYYNVKLTAESAES
jgi:Uma2 family endonuclease